MNLSVVKRIRPARSGIASSLVLLLSLCVLVPALVPPASGQAGVVWRDLTLDQALQEAAEKNTMVMIDIWREGCAQCGQMDIDVWQTERGAKLADGLIPIKIDSTSPEGRALSDRYPVTGLPCVLFLRSDGTELDRVTGYREKADFFRDAEPLHDGIDPMPLMEKHLKTDPDSLPLLFAAMERYQNRRLDAKADSMLQRILRVDSRNLKTYAERAIGQKGRYLEIAKKDYNGAAETWKMLVDRFPTSSSVGAALDGVARDYQYLGRNPEWLSWACAVLEKNPQAMMLQRQAAMVALHDGYRSPCLAAAARRSDMMFPGQKAFMDSIATVLEK